MSSRKFIWKSFSYIFKNYYEAVFACTGRDAPVLGPYPFIELWILFFQFWGNILLRHYYEETHAYNWNKMFGRKQKRILYKATSFSTFEKQIVLRCDIVILRLRYIAFLFLLFTL